MAVETFGVRNLDAAEDELASRDQRVDVVTAKLYRRKKSDQAIC
jgi:hypothetical protein